MGDALEIDNMITKLQAYNTVSFDLFDTVITRSFAKPADVFKEIESGLHSAAIDCPGFAELRVKAEFELRKKGNFQTEVTLDDIYAELAQYTDLHTAQLEHIRQEELAIEKSCLVVNTQMQTLLKELREQGTQILFISDIYLPEAFIRDVLERLELLFPQDRLYVSSASGRMKSTGKLFQQVLADNNLTPQQLCHIGDNLESDFNIPRKLGINAIHYTEALQNRYEKTSYEGLAYSKLIAASKLTRLQNPQQAQHNATIWNVSANVSAPLMFGFVHWCILQALEKRITKLYFLSRDGQILYKIAEQIIARYYVGKIAVKYLYVSRQSLLFPAIESLNNEALQWILAPTSVLTPRIILKRINFVVTEFSTWLEKFAFIDIQDKHLANEERNRFRAMLKAAEMDIMQRVNVFRENTLAYFAQEDLLTAEPFAVIDIGWNGTLQRSISRLLDLSGNDKPVYGFYFGIKGRKKHKDQDALFGWFTDYEKPRALDKKTYIIPMTELFTAAIHGGVVKYSVEQGCVNPELKHEKNITGLDWGVGIQQQAMLNFTENALKSMAVSEIEAISLTGVAFLERLYEMFILHPEKNEAMAYSLYQDAEDQNESYHVKLAEHYNACELIKVKLHNFKHHHNEWQEGALALSNHFLCSLLPKSRMRL